MNRANDAAVELLHSWTSATPLDSRISTPMIKTALLSLLTQLERELHGSAARSDALRLGELLHPEFVEFGCSGRRYGFSEIVAQLQQEPAAVAVHSQDFAARLVAEGVALLTCKSAQVGRDGALERHALRSSLWQQTPRGWQMLFHQGTPTQVFVQRAP